MSGAVMAPAERYWVLAHAATRPGADLTEPRASAGAVLLALRHLSGRPASGERQGKNLFYSPRVSLLEPAICTPHFDFVR